ncbi:MAG: sulfoxide reductase heme-binding subunit YedZ [Candidatus Saccharibacteria bacterium]|nr:sulfoxide reductase heme-binding subunit YedZ [Moraxellaceae bacterium]
MIYQAVFAQQLLGADPAKSLVDQSGLWAIKSILFALAMTPLRILTKQSFFIIFRRMTGLFAFFYAITHFLIYSILLLGLDLSQLGTELTRRPYIIVGFIALLLYVPLAITSTNGWQRQLKRNWIRLHKLVYVIGILAVIHMTWLKKLGLTTTWPYALALVILLGIRIVNTLNNRRMAQLKKH